MFKKKIRFTILISVVLFLAISCTSESIKTSPGTYEDLLQFFQEFREFQVPDIKDGIPDYSPGAMAEQAAGLKVLQGKLAAMDISNWPVSQQVDYHIVRAELNGLEFYHRILKPWSRDPVFYLFSQGGAGPVAYGRPRLSELPMSGEDLEVLKQRLVAVPSLFEQARINLTNASGDLALIALHFLKDEILIYENLGARLKDHHPDLLPLVDNALASVRSYGDWLEENKSSMTAPAGIGKENYNWYLKNVQLVPYTWDELMPSLMHEYEYAIAALKLEENKNRDLPPLKLISSNEESHEKWVKTEEFMNRFIQENEIYTVPEYIEHYNPGTWWNTPGEGHDRDFFEQCRDRNMLAEVVHNYLGHNLDGLRHSRDDRPIRGQRRLYAIDMIRSEGVAYGMEELMRLAGMYEEDPRGLEIHYAMKAFRVARGLADLKIHNHEFDLLESIQFCYDKTPNEWMLIDGFEGWYEMQTSLRFTGWHMGFNLGKIQLFKLIQDGAEVRGEDFVLADFLDEFFASGMIPFSLTRWEITGLTDEMEKLW
jgi:hypothetical protein